MPKAPVLTEKTIPVRGLAAAHEGLRVAHLTDIHVGRMTPQGHIRAAIELANSAEPDVIALTGDYVCWHRREVDLLRVQLAGLKAKAAVVACLGNHDYFADGEGVAAALDGLGYRVLRNQHHTLSLNGEPLHIVGLDDPVTRRHDFELAHRRIDEGTRIALSHCPEEADSLVERGADLVLSGHTHGGQIFLKGLTDRLFEKAGKRYYKSGLYPIGDGHLYLSAGVGFSGVRVRAGEGTQAEVALFTLRRA